MTGVPQPRTVAGPVVGLEISHIRYFDYEPILYSVQLANGVIVTRPSGFPVEPPSPEPRAPEGQGSD